MLNRPHVGDDPPARMITRAMRAASSPAPPGGALACEECGGPLRVLDEHARLYCDAFDCGRAAVAMNPADMADAHAARHGDPNPVGWPRPASAGRPVPWLTPVFGGIVWWKWVHGGRLIAAQAGWLCQVCGLPLAEAASVVADRFGRLYTAAGACERCARLAVTVCPVVHGDGGRAYTATRAELTGVPSADDLYAEPARRPVLKLPVPSFHWEYPAALGLW